MTAKVKEGKDMKNIKRIFAMLLVITLVASFASCGKDKESDVPVANSTQAPVTDYPTENYVEDTSAIDVTQAPPTTVPPTTQAPVTEAPTTTEPPTQAPETQPPQPTTGVGKYTSTYAGVEQAVFYPNSMLSSNEALPVIAFANGTGFSYTIYESLIEKIAEGGYIVVANSETMSADGSAQISSLDFAIAENSNSSSVLYGKVNTGKLGVAGHSQGGRSSVNAAAKDSRIACVLSLAGSNFVEEAQKLSAPALFFAGSKDLIVGAERWVVPAYDACKGPAVYACLDGGIHTTCSSSPEKYSAYAISWFDIWLKGDTAQKAVFQNGGQLSNDSAWVDYQSKGL